jgi:hypothetical protein
MIAPLGSRIAQANQQFVGQCHSVIGQTMKVAMVHFDYPPRLLPVRLTLLVPELIWPEPNDQLTLGKLSVPGFEWLAARASFERQAKQPFETALAAQFGLDAPLRRPAPARRSNRRRGPRRPLAVRRPGAPALSPRTHHPRRCRRLRSRRRRSPQRLATSLNETFADVGVFHVATARRWYLRLHQAVDHPVEPLTAMSPAVGSMAS